MSNPFIRALGTAHRRMYHERRTTQVLAKWLASTRGVFLDPGLQGTEIWDHALLSGENFNLQAVLTINGARKGARRMIMKAALINRDGKVVGEVFDAPEIGNTIDIAGAFTISGDAVNVKTWKISRSKRNMEKATFEQSVSKVETNHSPVWTFHCVEKVVY